MWMCLASCCWSCTVNTVHFLRTYMLCFDSKCFILLVLPPLFTISLLHIASDAKVAQFSNVSTHFWTFHHHWLHANTHTHTHTSCARISHAHRANDIHINQWRKMSSCCFYFFINIEVYVYKTTQVSITVSFVLKITGSPVLTQLRTGPKITGSRYPSLLIPNLWCFFFKLHVSLKWWLPTSG